jgi:prepilin-type N-terminal cleavage/methylation domain-containing protein
MNLIRKTRWHGFSLIELLIVISIILIILAISVSHYRQAMIFASEMAAQATVRSLHQAETQYYSTYGRFAASLEELGKPSGGAANASGADLIDADLAKGEKQGYRYSIRTTPNGYQINADPISYGIGGNRTFYSDQSHEIHAHSGREPASANDPEIK